MLPSTLRNSDIGFMISLKNYDLAGKISLVWTINRAVPPGSSSGKFALHQLHWRFGLLLFKQIYLFKLKPQRQLASDSTDICFLCAQIVYYDDISITQIAGAWFSYPERSVRSIDVLRETGVQSNLMLHWSVFILFLIRHIHRTGYPDTVDAPSSCQSRVIRFLPECPIYWVTSEWRVTPFACSL